ncbi:hypothetical protein [Paenibacillus thiaminolyticus]|uniref:Uncharacterized protein n=1 Tax=Paenibacillus thiaminolyticus TaxID=49283 RepID=A0A3A3GHY2_PANTH|nr:hypothetical protein [Paenibacillus thiaminolyticus]RJG22736.1 hypothetical protein DQX05_15920 [Paenibacillus thiaminolyticus]
MTLAVTKPNGETFDVTVEKEMLPSALPRVQQGQVLNVTYSPNAPAKLAISLPVSEADIQQTFCA